MVFMDKSAEGNPGEGGGHAAPYQFANLALNCAFWCILEPKLNKYMSIYNMEFEV